MPIGTRAKLQELSKCQRTDGSVGQEYDTFSREAWRCKTSL